MANDLSQKTGWNPDAVAAYHFLSQLAPPDYRDAVIEVYKRDVDRSMLRQNLALTPDERSRKFERSMELVFELRRAAKHSRSLPRESK